MRRTLLLLSLFSATTVRAGWPPPEGADLSVRGNQPNDPGYPGQWNFWSYVPASSAPLVSEYERKIGSGMHADRAWQKTIGDRRVVIAVIDSGATWKEGDLLNKYFLNAGELPPPTGCPGGDTGGDPHDANGDGWFNVQDYTTAVGHELPTAGTICADGVSDVNSNGFLDPQDLILVFSDGVDDDGNGYVDDISGWDAFHNDNDPQDDTQFGHGAGEARDSTAETDNGIGDAGVCPRCSVLMVRAGDSFIADGAEFAVGVFFAVDSGAAVIQEALGAIDNPPIAQHAIEYAVREGLSIVGSAADEDSFHHNYPAANRHVIDVHAVVYDSLSRESATTFLNFNNCTNYGAQLLLSTPGAGCSSEATGKTAGIVGLVASAALEAGLEPAATGGYATDKLGARRLDGEEMKQLLLTTVDDIYDPATVTDPLRYPTRVGWEQRFGYGRTNARAAVDAVLAGRIPPVVDIASPGWFQTIYPDRTPIVMIEGHVRFRHERFDSYDYVVEWAPGVEPDDEAFSTIAEGQGETENLDGALAAWDLSKVVVDNPAMPRPDVDVNRFMVTIRVRVVLHGDGAVEGTRGETRRAVHVLRDESLVAGYPVALGGSLESSPKISDVDGDGRMELVQADAAGWVHVLTADATEVTGWPQPLGLLPAVDPADPGNHLASRAVATGALEADTRSSLMATPALGDLDGSGGPDKDVVAFSIEGEVFAWSAHGQLVPGFPVRVDPEAGRGGDPKNLVDVALFASPVLGDLDGNGDLEIVAAAGDGRIYAWHHDGSVVAGFPVLLQRRDQQRRIVATPALGDLDGDGRPEIVVGTTEDYSNTGFLYALHGDGSMVDGWPKSQRSVRILPFIGEGLPNSPCMADVDGDGAVEVAASGIVVTPRILDGDGEELGYVDNTHFGAAATTDDNPFIVMVSNGAFGDLDSDGVPDLVWGGAGFAAAEAFSGSGVRKDFDHQLAVWSIGRKLPEDGYSFLPGFPQRVDDWQFFENPAIADLDDDGHPEVINGSGGYYLRAFDAEGKQPAGWPKMTGQWIISSPAVGDLDGDGFLEVAAGTRSGNLFAWHTAGRTNGRVDWASFHHDDANTGNLEAPLAFGVRAAPGEGCGCRVGGGGSGSAHVLVLAFVVAARFRRRRG